MAQVTFTSVALENLHSIHLHISQDSPYYADKVVDKIINRVAILEKNTRIGRIVPEFNNPDIRQLLDGSYRIIYEIRNEDEIFILRIYHSARLLKNL